MRLYAAVCMYVFEHGRRDVQERMDAHGRMAIADSEQQGRFDSVHVQLPTQRAGLY